MSIRIGLGLLSIVVVSVVNLAHCEAEDSKNAKVSERKAQIDAARNNAFAPAGYLTAVADTVPGQKPYETCFDFGEIDYLDPYAGSPKGPAREMFDTMLGVRHYFEYRNDTAKPISMGRMITHCPCVDMVPVDSSGKMNNDFVLKRGESVKFFVILDYRKLAPGAINSTVEVLGSDLKSPIAVMEVRGKLRGGVRFKPGVIDFGSPDHVDISKQRFEISLDGRMTNFLPPNVPLRVVCTNPFVIVSPHQPVPSSKELLIRGNDLLLRPQFNQQHDEVPLGDQTVTFDAEISTKAPLGPITGEVLIQVPGFPNYMLTRTDMLPLSGTRVGHLDVQWPAILDFGTVRLGTEVDVSLPIGVRNPVTSKDIVLQCSNPNLLLSVGSAVEPRSDVSHTRTPGADGSALGGQSSKFKLNAHLKKSAPLGAISGFVTVSTPTNGEWLRIPVIGLVKK